MAFATLTLARLFHGFNCRGQESVFRLGFQSNPFSLAAFGGGVLLLAAVLFVPGLNTLFQAVALDGVHIAQIVGLAVIPTLLIQIFKLIRDAREK